ncbi:MAG: TraG/TraD/VirD4 family protein [Actinomycetota bacterium]|nr:TraG/TraD/VirD4 family protein [Actinomycetota bacterium]
MTAVGNPTRREDSADDPGRHVTYRTRSGSGLHGGWSQTIQQRPVIPPERINTMPPGVGYLAHTNHLPLYVTLTPPPAPSARTGLTDLARPLRSAWRRAVHTCRSPLTNRKDDS